MLLLLAFGVWSGLKMVEAKVTYRHMARAAGESYAIYYQGQGVWPDDLPKALAYARDHAEKGTWLYSVTHDEKLMSYLDDMEVLPGLEKELSPEIGDWKYGDGRFEEVIEKGRLVSPLRVKSSKSTDEGDRIAFTRDFYVGIVITLGDVATTQSRERAAKTQPWDAKQE
jgi:hypothetical protein